MTLKVHIKGGGEKKKETRQAVVTCVTVLALLDDLKSPYFWNELIRRSLMMWFHVHNTHGWPSGVVIYVAGFVYRSLTKLTFSQVSRRFALRAQGAWPDPQFICNPLCRSYSVRCCSYSAAHRSYSVRSDGWFKWLWAQSFRAVLATIENGSTSFPGV